MTGSRSRTSAWRSRTASFRERHVAILVSHVLALSGRRALLRAYPEEITPEIPVDPLNLLFQPARSTGSEGDLGETFGVRISSESCVETRAYRHGECRAVQPRLAQVVMQVVTASRAGIRSRRRADSAPPGPYKARRGRVTFTRRRRISIASCVIDARYNDHDVRAFRRSAPALLPIALTRFCTIAHSETMHPMSDLQWSVRIATSMLALSLVGCGASGTAGVNATPPPGCAMVNDCGGDVIGTWKVLGGCSNALVGLLCPPNTLRISWAKGSRAR